MKINVYLPRNPNQRTERIEAAVSSMRDMLLKYSQLGVSEVNIVIDTYLTLPHAANNGDFGPAENAVNNYIGGVAWTPFAHEGVAGVIGPAGANA